MDRLPNEILEKIFLDCVQSLPELTLVCKKFYETIGKSCRLMSYFEVQFEKRKMDMRPILKSERKYTRMVITDTKDTKSTLIKFVQNHQYTLNSVSLTNCSFTSSAMHNLLKLVKDNLSLLSMCDCNFEVDSKVEKIHMPKLKDLEIMYGYNEGYISIFDFFEDAGVTWLNYEDDYEMTDEEIDRFSRIVASFKKLKNLSVGHNVSQRMFQTRYFLHNVEFQIESLHIFFEGQHNFFKFDVFYKACFNKFLAKQTALKKLILCRCDISSNMLDFILQLNLEHFGLVYSNFIVDGPIRKNFTIKTLFISLEEEFEDHSADEIVLCDLMRNCAVVEKLHFVNCNVTFEMSIIMAHELRCFRKLKMLDCEFLPFYYPTLQQLELSYITSIFEEDYIRLIRVNRHVKKLKLDRSIAISPDFLNIRHELNPYISIN